MPETEVRAHPLRTKRGLAVRRQHMRMIEEIPDHPDLRTGGVERKHGGLRDDMIQRVATGETDYAANGPWEVAKERGEIVLYHYGHPLARAKGDDLTAEARAGYGFSTTDMRGVREFAGVLGLEAPEMRQEAFTPYVYNRMGNRVGVGYDAEGKLRRYDTFTGELIDPRKYPEGDWRRTARAPMSRMSPYAILDRELGVSNTDRGKTHYFPSRRYPGRRGRR